jgi:hypothetical protein
MALQRTPYLPRSRATVPCQFNDAFFGRTVVSLTNRSKTRLGTRIHNDAGALLAEHHGGVPNEVEVSLKVNRNHTIPFLFAHVEDHAVPQVSGVVDQDVQPPEIIEGLLDGALAVVVLSDVSIVRHSSTAYRLDFVRDLLRRRPVITLPGLSAANVVYNDGDTLPCQFKRFSPPDAPTCVGDDSHVAF